MDLKFGAPTFETPIGYVHATVITQEERDALAERIEKVILERRKVGAERRMQTRLRQLQSIERARERYAITS